MSTEPRRRRGRRERRGPGPARPPVLACVAEKRSELEAWMAKPLPLVTPHGLRVAPYETGGREPPVPFPAPAFLTPHQAPAPTPDPGRVATLLSAAGCGAGGHPAFPLLPSATGTRPSRWKPWKHNRNTSPSGAAVPTFAAGSRARGISLALTPRRRWLTDAPHRVTHEFRTKQPEKPSS